MANNHSHNISSYTFKSCTDNQGRIIPHGLLFAPGLHECKICHCQDGTAVGCRATLCAPPSDCSAINHIHHCCRWVCGPNGVGKYSTDIGLRLIASGITAILSVGLLFFLIYRLRQRRLQNDLLRRQRMREGDSVFSLDYGVFGPGTNNTATHHRSSCMEGVFSARNNIDAFAYGWWKPSDFVGSRIAPPSYNDAMANSCLNNSCGDVRSSSSENSEAPPYNEIHLDPVVPQPVGTIHALPGAARVLPPLPGNVLRRQSAVEPRQTARQLIEESRSTSSFSDPLRTSEMAYMEGMVNPLGVLP